MISLSQSASCWALDFVEIEDYLSDCTVSRDDLDGRYEFL